MSPLQILDGEVITVKKEKLEQPNHEQLSFVIS